MALLLAKQILQLFLILLCGYAIVKTGLLKASDSKVLSILIVYIICPCTILNAFQIEFTSEVASGFLLAVLFAVLIHVLLFVIVYGMDRFFPLNTIEKGSLLYSNAGNLIIPMVMAVLGEEWLIYASAFLVTQLMIIWTHGKSLIEEKRGTDIRSILTNVNLIACIIGLIMFLTHIQFPEILQSTIKTLGSTIGAVSMLMIGMILAGCDIKSMVQGKRIWIITILKMFVVPSAVILIMKYSGLTGLNPNGVTILYISLLAVMTPSAATVTQMAQLYGKDAGYATAINTVTTLVCLGSMPLLTMLYYL